MFIFINWIAFKFVFDQITYFKACMIKTAFITKDIYLESSKEFKRPLILYVKYDIPRPHDLLINVVTYDNPSTKPFIST